MLTCRRRLLDNRPGPSLVNIPGLSRISLSNLPMWVRTLPPLYPSSLGIAVTPRVMATRGNRLTRRMIQLTPCSRLILPTLSTLLLKKATRFVLLWTRWPTTPKAAAPLELEEFRIATNLFLPTLKETLLIVPAFFLLQSPAIPPNLTVARLTWF